MNHRALLSIAVAIGAHLASLSFAAETNAKKHWKLPRTETGAPDLQGFWNNATLTPLERPPKFGNRQALTENEAREMEQTEAELLKAGDAPTDPKKGIKDLPTSCGKGFTGVDCGYNSFWIDAGTRVMRIDGEARTSILVDPPSGRVPALLPARQQFMMGLLRTMRGNADGPEVRTLGERCLLAFGSSSGPPMLPTLYNNNYQIVQTQDTVTILVEMVHDARIIRIGGTHPPKNVRKWMGDSIGHWEDNTLVVETTNFTDKEYFRGASQNLKVTERFTRADAGTIRYKFTVEDPSAFTAPFSGEVAFHLSDQPVYEYACHEGNYALPGILAGAREEERAAAAKK